MYSKKNKKMVSAYVDTKDNAFLKSDDRKLHVLVYIFRQMDMEKNNWYADKINKQYIMNKLGISAPTLDKHIASLKRKEYIFSAEVRGRYRINLELFDI